MTEEKSFLLVCLGIHRDKTATRGEKDDILVRYLGPLEVQALLWRVPDNVLELHDWIHVELRIDLPGLTNIHSCLIWPTGDITMRTWHAKSSHA